MNDTVTDTMTVDLTKEIVNDVNTVECVRKKVGWHDKRNGVKRLFLTKKDGLAVDVGDYVYVLTESEFKKLNKNRVCEEKSWWKRILKLKN